MPQSRHHAKHKSRKEQFRGWSEKDRDLLKELLGKIVQQVPEAEMEDALHAGKRERTAHRPRQRIELNGPALGTAAEAA